MTPTPAPPNAPGVLDVTRQPVNKKQILRPDSPFNKALTSLIQTKVRAESDPEQAKVFARIRRNNLYYRGMQYLSMTRLPDGSVDYRPVSGGSMTPFSPAQNTQDEMYDNILPLFRGDVRKWCGVLGVRSPNAKCEPRTVGDDHQIRLARIGDRAISYLRDSWKADNLQRYLAYSLAVNGTTFGYVNFVADEKKYGYTEVPKIETKMVPAGESYFVCARCGAENPVMTAQQTNRCAQCEFPLGPEDFREPELIPGLVQTGTMRYANGAVELQLATGATVKTPYYINDLEHCPWLWYEYLVNRYELVRSYAPAPSPKDSPEDAQYRRELREHLLKSTATGGTAGGASSAEVRRTANTLSSPSGQPFERKSLEAFGQYFLSPGMLEAMSDDEDRDGNLREQLSAKYPKGLHLIYIGSKLADVREAAIAERWTVCQPDVGDYIYRDAVFDDYIQGVDVINDTLNIIIQQAEKSNPLTVFDPDVLDPDLLRNKSVQVGEFLEGKRGVGSQLSQSFFRMPSSEVNPALLQFMEFYIEKNRENVGIMPAIYGGGDADEAVGVAKIRRNQSLMQLNVPWNYMRDFWGSTYQNGIRLLAAYSNGKLVMNRGGSIELEELDGIWELQQGGIQIQCEEAMPMTWAQRQEQVESMLSRPPQAWPLLGLTDPSGAPLPANVEQMQDAVGLPDWQVPGLAARERLLDIVSQLVKAEPVEQPPEPQLDPMGNPLPPGPPPPPQPSITPNTTIFDAPFAVAVLRDWLVSDKGREAEHGLLPEQGPRGFENVLAYTQAWMLIANPPPPPMLPGPGPDGGPPPDEPKVPPDQRGVAAPPPPGQGGMAAPPPNQMPVGPPPGTIQ
jgi:hypothetical protein